MFWWRIVDHASCVSDSDFALIENNFNKRIFYQGNNPFLLKIFRLAHLLLKWHKLQ